MWEFCVHMGREVCLCVSVCLWCTFSSVCFCVPRSVYLCTGGQPPSAHLLIQAVPSLDLIPFP